MKFKAYLFFISILLLIFLPEKIYSGGKKSGVKVMAFVEQDYYAIAGAVIDLMEGEEKISTTSTNRSGKFKFFLELNKEYTIVVSKEGFASKKVKFITDVPGDMQGVWKCGFVVELFEEDKILEGYYLEKPVALIKYDEKEGYFHQDIKYTEIMKMEIEEITGMLEAGDVIDREIRVPLDKLSEKFVDLDYNGDMFISFDELIVIIDSFFESNSELTITDIRLLIAAFII